MRLQGRNLLVLCMVALMVSMETNVQGEIFMFDTFNLALGPELGPTELRIKEIINALRQSPADFLCLQEVWIEPDLKELVEGLKDEFPYQFSFLHSDVNTLRPEENSDMLHQMMGVKDNACNLREVVRLGDNVSRCFEENKCNGTNPILGIGCLTTNCKDELNDPEVSKACMACVSVSSIGGFYDNYGRCSLNKKENNRMNNPGLVVLSKNKLKNVSYTDLYPNNRPSIPRGYIEAVMEKDGEEVKAVCTHLSFNLPWYLEADLDFGNYTAQRKNEIEILKENLMDQEHVLLGDFNIGPKNLAGDGDEFLLGASSESYNILLGQGYTSCYNEKCTMCSTNPLNLFNQPNELQSHVLFKGKSLSCLSEHNGKRVYDDPKRSLSDQYGLRVPVHKQRIGSGVATEGEKNKEFENEYGDDDETLPEIGLIDTLELFLDRAPYKGSPNRQGNRYG